jgi:hypothetical protein
MACTDTGCSSNCVGLTNDSKPITISSLNHEVTYHACVQAVDTAGNTSDYINSNNSVTTPQAAPNEITDLTATAKSSSSVTLNWISGGGSTAGFYVAYASGATAPSDCTGSATLVIGSTSYEVTGLSAGTQYSFRVCSINSNPTPDASSGQTASATPSHCAELSNGVWLLVPADPVYGTSNFCVMKYEAKHVSSKPNSNASGTPWVFISFTTAKKSMPVYRCSANI